MKVSLEVDITKTKENQLKLEEAYKEIGERLKEKEVLLKEIYHRTKNSMQIISSMLSLRAAAVNDPHLTDIFSEMQARIKAIALVHEKIYTGENLSKVNLKDYITALSNLLVDGQSAGGKILLRLDLEDVDLLIDMAIPCGLVITEIILNTTKHAFPGSMRGHIAICLKRLGEKEIEIKIEDNGIGFNADEVITENKLGLQLIRGISEDQLDGKVELDTSNGTAWTIRFQDVLYYERV